MIHGLQGAVASGTFILLKRFFLKTDSGKKEAVIAVVSSILPALIVILGYFLKRIYWEGRLPEAALLKMPANVLQEIIGIVVAVLICYVSGLKRQLKKARLLPDFTGEMLKKKEETQLNQ